MKIGKLFIVALLPFLSPMDVTAAGGGLTVAINTVINSCLDNYYADSNYQIGNVLYQFLCVYESKEECRCTCRYTVSDYPNMVSYTSLPVAIATCLRLMPDVLDHYNNQEEHSLP